MKMLWGVRERLRTSWGQAGGTRRETEMAINRFVANLVVAASIMLGILGRDATMQLVSAGIVYLTCSFLILFHLLLRPSESFLRQGVAMVLDFGAVTVTLLFGGHAMAWLFPAYLWIVFGNGFRFGPQSLVAAMLVSLCGFGTVAAFSPYWQGLPALSLGVLLGLTVLPLYALTLLNRLSKARLQAEEANLAKSLFLASVSHELRTPLNAIIGMGALLNDSRLDRDQAEASQTISTSANVLLSLIDGILDLSRIEAGRMPQTEVDFDLAELLRDLRIIFLPGARQKGLRLDVYVAPQTPLALKGDLRRLREILLNLLGNALKFTPAGAVSLSVAVAHRGEATCRLRFEVVDSGIGIAPAAQQKIFDPFSQADDTIVTRFGGTGLGLAISQKLVRLLGGEIGVHSSLGQGSRFWLELDFGLGIEDSDLLPQYASMQAYLFGLEPAAAAAWTAALQRHGIAAMAMPIEALAEVGFAWSNPYRPKCGVLALQSEDAGGMAGYFRGVHTAGTLSYVALGHHDIASPGSEDWLSLLQDPGDDAGMQTVLRLAACLGRVVRPSAETMLPVARVRFHVLVADDNSINRRVMTRLLTAIGHDVTVADDGEQALDLLAERRFDIAIFDVNMPVLGGIEAAKLYRMSTIGDPAVPILALTADATTKTRDECLAAGMHACLVKPLAPAALMEAIDNAVDRVLTVAGPMPLVRPVVVGRTPPLDPRTLASLTSIGGPEFAAEIARDFRLEARVKLRALHEAASSDDVAEFRSGAHALRSIAANIGALPLCELCQPHQTISAVQLETFAERYLSQIEAELDRLDDALMAFNSGAAQIGH